jgi:hypothetical protein
MPVPLALVRLVPIILSAALRTFAPVASKLLERNDDEAYAATIARAAMSRRAVMTTEQKLLSEEEARETFRRETAIMHWLVVQALCRRTLEQLEVEMFETQTTDDLWLHHEISHYKERIADLQQEDESLEGEYASAVSAINPAGIRFGVVRYDRSGVLSQETLANDGREHKEDLERLVKLTVEKLADLV